MPEVIRIPPISTVSPGWIHLAAERWACRELAVGCRGVMAASRCCDAPMRDRVAGAPEHVKLLLEFEDVGQGADFRLVWIGGFEAPLLGGLPAVELLPHPLRVLKQEVEVLRP